MNFEFILIAFIEKIIFITDCVGFIFKPNLFSFKNKKMKTKFINNSKFLFALSCFLMFGITIKAQTVTFNWADKTGSNLTDENRSMVVDGSGNVFSTGNFSGTVDMDPGSGTYNLSSAGDMDIYVQKLDASGAFVWAVSIGGSQLDFANAIALDASGNIFVTGGFTGTADFDPGSGTYDLTSAPHYTTILKTKLSDKNDAFILKLDGSGNLAWAKQVGAGGRDFGVSLAIDNSGNVIITGEWSDLNEKFDTCDFNPGSGVFLLTNGGAFVLKLNYNGDFVWADGFGSYALITGMGSPTDFMYTNKTYTVNSSSLVTDGSGKIYITGYFSNGKVDFDPGSGVYELSAIGYKDIFVLVLNSDGSLNAVKQMGGTLGTAKGNSMNIDGSGNIYTTGYFTGPVDFDPGSSVNTITSYGYSANKTSYSDMFVSKLNSSLNFVWARQIGGTTADIGNSIDIAGNGSVYCTGSFTGKSDFNPASGKSTYYLTSKGGLDAFVLKLDASGNFGWAKQLGGTADDIGNTIALSGTSSTVIHTAGYFNGTVDFDPGTSTVNLTSDGGKDAFIHKMTESTSYTKRTAPSIVESKQGFNNFPNPVKDIIYAEVSELIIEGKLKIIDTKGTLIYEISINNQQNIEIDVSFLPSGIYYLTVNSDKVNTSKRFVKQ